MPALTRQMRKEGCYINKGDSMKKIILLGFLLLAATKAHADCATTLADCHSSVGYYYDQMIEDQHSQDEEHTRERREFEARENAEDNEDDEGHMREVYSAGYSQ